MTLMPLYNYNSRNAGEGLCNEHISSNNILFSKVRVTIDMFIDLSLVCSCE